MNIKLNFFFFSVTTIYRGTFENLFTTINNYNDKYFGQELPFTQKLYNYLYDIIEIPKCDNCGNLIKWRGIFTEGYLKNCSKKCKDKSKLRIERTKATNLVKYGVDSVLKFNILMDIYLKALEVFVITDLILMLNYQQSYYQLVVQNLREKLKFKIFCQKIILLMNYVIEKN